MNRVQNEVGDLFSLFEFLGKKIVAPMHDYSEFKAKIADPLKNKRAKTGMARLVVRLSFSSVPQYLVLRRLFHCLGHPQSCHVEKDKGHAG